MGVFSIIETFIFFSLAISFVLILLLVYHFKSRMAKLEEKTDTMVGIINDIAKELANAPIIGQAPPPGCAAGPDGMCTGPPPGIPPMPPMGGGIPGIPPLGGMPFPMSFMMNMDPFAGMAPDGMAAFGVSMGGAPAAPIHPESDQVEEIDAEQIDSESDDDSDSGSDDESDAAIDEVDIDQEIRVVDEVTPVDMIPADATSDPVLKKIVVPDMSTPDVVGSAATGSIAPEVAEDHDARKRTLPELRQEAVAKGLVREKDAAKMKKGELIQMLTSANVPV